MGKGSGTRSGLLWEVERLLKESKELPQVLLMENVPQVIGKKNIGAFAEWVAFLDSLGYHSKWEVINATEYAVPQNRQRCFMVSVLGDHFYNFPKKIGNTRKLRDLLEDNVPENYYLSEKILQYFIKHTNECAEKGQGFKFAPSNGGGHCESSDDLCGQPNGRQLCCIISDCGKRFEKLTNTAYCIMARDYKNTGKQSTNGVIVWKK